MRRGSINIWLVTEPNPATHDSLDSYQIPQRAKSFVAKSSDDNQMFRPPERAVLLAMLDDALSESRANAGKFLQLFRRSDVDVDLFRVSRRLNRANGL